MLLPQLALEHPLTAVPLLFAGGVLTSLTPCIYPMIPITAAIVGGQSVGAPAVPGLGAGWRERARPAALTLTYVTGLALVYSVLGLVAGLSGQIFGAISSNPWLYLTMANVLLVGALSMLDVLPVRLPAALVRRATEAGHGGTFTGVFAMGAVSGLVAAPCSAPVMAGVLTWVAVTRSGLLGFIYLFAFSLGMCAVLVAVGLSAGAIGRLPRAGAWMLGVKRVFAAIMIAAAEFYLVKMGELLS